MNNDKLKNMSFEKLYGALIAKAVRKGRTQEEVDVLTSWLSGYTAVQITDMMQDGTSYGDFFDHAPSWNPLASKIKGRICNVRVEEIEDPFMWRVRCLDKLVDDLAKGKSIEKIIPQDQ